MTVNKYSSRVKHLEKVLANLQYFMALRALDLVMEEMCAEKGFVRYSGVHYYFHLVDVAQKLLNYGIRDEDIITAGLLHDIVEDVEGYTVNMIQRMFNDRVASLVEKVTKKPGVDYKIEKNMEEYLETISQDVGAALIKTVDRMHNFGTLREASMEKKMKQVVETEKYFIPFFKKCRDLYPRYSHIFFEAKTQIEPHLWEIKEHYEDVMKLQKRIEELEARLSLWENKKEGEVK